MFTHFDDVLKVAEQQWDQAQQSFKSEPTIESYTKMQLAGEQLLSMKQMLERIDEELPRLALFESLKKNIGKELSTTTGWERELKANIHLDFGRMVDAVAEANEKTSDNLNRINQAVAERNIEKTLDSASKRFSKTDSAVIKKLFKKCKAFEGSDLKQYITSKHALFGVLSLPNSKTLYPKIHAFCQREENRLTQQEERFIDFNELVLAEMMHKGQPEPGIFSRIFKAIAPDPANWSDETKRKVGLGFTALQFIEQVRNMMPSSSSKKIAPETTLTKEQAEAVNDETALLGILLHDRYKAIQNEAILDKFTNKMPDVFKQTVQDILKHYPKQPTPTEQSTLMNGYKTLRQNMILGKEYDKNWITGNGAKPAQMKPIGFLADKPNVGKAALPIVEGLGPFTKPSPETKQEIIGNLKQAVQTTDTLHTSLTQCSRNEFLSFKSPTTPVALHELRKELALMRQSLGETMMSKPAEQSPIPGWVEWSQSVQKQCHNLKNLEGRIATAMSTYEEKLAMSNYKSYMPLTELGNKHINLVKQHDIVEAIGLDGVNVPLPQGVSSSRILNFLQTYSPEIFDHWNAIRDLYANAKDKTTILENPEILAHLDKIDQGIEKAFLKASTDDKAFESLGFSKQTKDWLNELSKKGTYLMVRSTGAEDSKQSANAGGNASISYVKPDRKELCPALGEVARSYFGVGSLQKRLNADLNPFEDELKVAVTTQELIGEEVGGAKDPSQIPISMVLFTSEPLFIGGEKFRAMRISATYGHGEGVVGNKGIGTDSALLLVSAADPSKLYILYDNQEKPERLAPVRDANGKVSLQKIANSEEMAKRPVLSNDLITRLYEWGVIGEKFYDGDPTDMEIVIKGNTIYPVQARPINRPPLSASFLDRKKISESALSPITKNLRTEMIVPGKASVVEITNPNEILIIDTLEKAEAAFKKGQHKLVVVGQSEPANSIR